MNIDWESYDKAQRERDEWLDGFYATDYTGNKCENCGRNRVINCVNGRHVCEKCGWDADQHNYSGWNPCG